MLLADRRGVDVQPPGAGGAALRRSLEEPETVPGGEHPPGRSGPLARREERPFRQPALLVDPAELLGVRVGVDGGHGFAPSHRHVAVIGGGTELVAERLQPPAPARGRRRGRRGLVQLIPLGAVGGEGPEPHEEEVGGEEAAHDDAGCRRLGTPVQIGLQEPGRLVGRPFPYHGHRRDERRWL